MSTSTVVVAAASAGAGLIAGFVLRSFVRSAAYRMSRTRSRSQLMSTSSDEGDLTDDEVIAYLLHNTQC